MMEIVERLGEGYGGGGVESGGRVVESSLYVGAPMHDEAVKVLHKENAAGSMTVTLAWLEGQFPVSY